MNTVSVLLDKAKDSLHAARLLAAEGLFDCAMSRTYFSMHYVAEAFLLTVRLDVNDPRDVIDAFGQRFAYSSELPPIFHRWLVEAEHLRNRADFETNLCLTPDAVAEQLDRARAFFNMAREEMEPSLASR
ncbi:HEPN domain protein [Solidesulfovibrio fructosivorans JJ]]|uniref:HEPN domain protein n=1 Tax=Solidesulfovibrio fructosivorans JJ] TaxID=596151 RepID=E1JYH9_SOLFR|nr:HEPN domain-containing protein [Solidesulfovibrio fructosivorans]EFL50563.1 HEPN domain protein [Solidesulfovibrio fructosivorans JJ]]